MISTDNHLGYKEADPVIGNDSFRTFDEMLETANNLSVDFVLLGGDLFHDSRPTASCYHKASQILNKHIFGDNKINSASKLSQTESVTNRVTFETHNYEDANYMSKNHLIKMPVFSIHGNHDSPIGLDLLSSMD